MKKQIFILVFLVLASFANIEKSFGQLVPRVVDITCLPSDALHPIPGSPYNYIVNVPNPAGTKSYEWFVTQDKNFITAGGLTGTRDIVGAAGTHISANGAGYNNSGTGTATLSLTWNSFVHNPALPVFVVIQVKSTVAGECSPNNLKVFRIEPVNAFTLDIANIKPDKSLEGYETSTNICIAPIVSASYDVASESVVYDFGVNYLYYEVVAANFSTSWKPSLKVNLIDVKETVSAVDWFRPADLLFATPVAMTLSGTIYTSATPVLALDATGTVGAAGESIIIRVTIDHTVGLKQYLGLTNETVTIAVDGITQLALATPLGDIHSSASYGSVTRVADCGNEDLFRNDVATQVILARPDVQTATPAVPGPGNSSFLPVK